MNFLAARHEHAAHLPEGEHTTQDPIDGILWAHILIMGFTFGIVYPVGMILGLTRNRWHVPCQSLGAILTLTGFFIGHLHKGRQFESGNIHSKFGSILIIVVLVQLALGIILKLHINKGIWGKFRSLLVKLHYIIAILIPIASWVQIGFGVIVLEGFCHADHLGQCLAHGIMGSSFIAYGYILTIMLFFGDKVLAKRNKSQEFYDSSVITLWGIINTFTEHRWGQNWSHGDYQHTSMGIIWWCAGMVGILLSRDKVTKQFSRRNPVPALVMIFTGWAMSEHAQHLMISTKVHAFFGYALMAAGISRIIEVSFILKDEPADSSKIRSFQYLTPFLLIESGICFCGANEEQLAYLNEAGIDHSSYLLVLSSCAFLIYLLCLGLIHLYTNLKNSDDSNNGGDNEWKGQHMPLPTSDPDIEMDSFLESGINNRRHDSSNAQRAVDVVLDEEYDDDVESLTNIR